VTETATEVGIGPSLSSELDVGRLLDVERIYLEPTVPDWARGREILDRFPDAERIEVPSHWQIPGLHGNGGNVADWLRIKRGVLVLGEKKSLSARRNGRSSDWIAPSTANGCAMACSYCYVPRRKGYANPITLFVNTEKILGYLERHVGRQGPKTEPNQCDPTAWVYDIGESSDCSVDALLSDNVADLVALFARLDGAKASFATKYVNRQLLDLDPQGGTRVRFSLMPADVSRKVALRTSRAARLRPPRQDARPLQPDAGRRGEAARRAHLAGGRPDRRHRRLRGRRLRGAREPQPGHRPRRLAGGMGRAADPARRRDRHRGEGAAEGRGDLPHAQRGPAPGEPRVAPARRGPAVASRPAAVQALELIDRRTPWLGVRYAF
jgi:hypothetical protein